MLKKNSIFRFSADSCFRDKSGINQQCPKFIFNPDKDGYSLRNHFLLLCERDYLGEFTNMFFFIGLAISGAAGGLLADKYGRKPLGVCSTSLMAIGGYLFYVIITGVSTIALPTLLAVICYKRSLLPNEISCTEFPKNCTELVLRRVDCKAEASQLQRGFFL